MLEEALPASEGLGEMVGQGKVREFVMSAEGDFELVFMVRPGELEAARWACRLTVIGEVVEEGSGWRRRARGYASRLRMIPESHANREGREVASFLNR